MKKNYLEIYNSLFDKKKFEVEIEYKNRLLNYKKNGFNKDYAFNQFYQNKPPEIAKSKFENKEVAELEKEFDNRGKIYDKQNELKAIYEFLIPKFENLKENYFNDFDSFIKELAIYKAWKFIDYEFELNNPTYKLMYRLNLLKDFKIINFNGRENSEMFFKYHALRYPKENNPFLHLKKLHDKKIYSFSTHDKSTYNLIFNSKRCYYYLVRKDYIDTFTSFEDYNNVFLKNFTENKSYVKFHATTIKAAVFLRKLQDLNQKIDLEKVGESKKFKSSRGNILKGKNLRQQHSQAKMDLIKEVEFDINYLIDLVRTDTSVYGV